MINAATFMLDNSIINNNDSLINNTICGNDDFINTDPLSYTSPKHLYGLFQIPTLMFPPCYLPYLK